MPVIIGSARIDENNHATAVMNKILHACGLSSTARWIDTGKSADHRYNLMCSNCGCVVHKRTKPDTCPECKLVVS